MKFISYSGSSFKRLAILKIMRVLITPCLLLFSVNSYSATQHDWPQYHGNAMHTGYLPITINADPAKIKLLWTQTLGLNDGYYSPSSLIAAGDTLYVTYRNKLFAIDKEQGGIVWTANSIGMEDFGSPIYYNGKIFAYKEHALMSFDAKTGQLLQSYNYNYYYYSGGMPVATDDSIFVTLTYGIYSFFPDDLHVINDYPFINHHCSVNRVCFDDITPTFVGNFLVYYVNNYCDNPYVTCFDTLNVVDIKNNQHYFEIETPRDIQVRHSRQSFPVLGLSDTTVAVIDTEGYLSIYDLIKRTITKRIGPGYYGMIIADDKAIYAQKGFSLDVIDKATGKILWSISFTDPNQPYGDMVVTNDLLIVQSNWNLIFISKKTHKVIKKIPFRENPDDPKRNFRGGQLALSDGQLYIYTGGTRYINEQVHAISLGGSN